MKLLEEVGSDPWDRPYKVVMKQLKSSLMASSTDPMLLWTIVTKLFMQQLNCDKQIDHNTVKSIPLLTTGEHEKACAIIGNQKTQELDGILKIALKTAMEVAPEMFLHMYNRCLQECNFSTDCKQQRLVLLSRRKKPSDELLSYRPLCKLSTAGKVRE